MKNSKNGETKKARPGFWPGAAGLALALLALVLALWTGGEKGGAPQSGGTSQRDGTAASQRDNAPEDGALPADTPPALPPGWALTLVNDGNPLPENFAPRTRNIAGYDDRPFDTRAADDLEAMLADAEKAGCKLYLVSAYRSVARQKALFRRKVNFYVNKGYAADTAEGMAARWVARPGCSEHNLGLAADIVSAGWYASHTDLTAEFDRTPEYAWLSAHCTGYGFVLRYPAGKEALTGVEYEPWHYRYVGKEAAGEMAAMGQCLEEYLVG